MECSPCAMLVNKYQNAETTIYAKYDCPHENAVIHLAIVMKYKALRRPVDITGDFYLGLVSPKKLDDKAHHQDAFGMSGSYLKLS